MKFHFQFSYKKGSSNFSRHVYSHWKLVEIA